MQEHNIIEGLQAVLQQAFHSLKPKNKSSHGAALPSELHIPPTVDKGALARGLLALLQHAGNLAADPYASLRTNLRRVISAGLRQQPWLWQLFVRRHLSDLLQQPAALVLLLEAITELEGSVQAKSYAVLSCRLRQEIPESLLENTDALMIVQEAALAVVQGCLTLLSQGFSLPNAVGLATADGNSGPPTATSQLHVHLALQLPAALQLLFDMHLLLGGVAVGENAPTVAEAAVSCAAMLAAHMCDPDALYASCQFPHSDPKPKEGSKWSSQETIGPEDFASVHVALHSATVLIETLVMNPEVLERTTTSMHTANDGTSIIASLLAVQCELSQLLSVTACKRSSSKAGPAPWRLETCALLLQRALTAGPEPHTSLLTLPPPVVSTMLETIRGALADQRISNTQEGICYGILENSMKLHDVCFAGLFQPQSALMKGEGFVAAMSIGRRLHTLLLTNRSLQNDMTYGSLKLPRQSTKVLESKKGSRKRKVDSNQGASDRGAVAELLQLFAASGGTGDNSCGESTQVGAESAGLQPHQTTGNANGRRRIVPVAIDEQCPSLSKSRGISNGAAFIVNAQNEDACTAEDGEPQVTDPLETSVALLPKDSGRVIMTATLEMDDSAREAMWKAYIADKDELVEMLGDSAYQQYYDEASHPVPSAKRPSMGMDSAFDAIFGKVEEINNVKGGAMSLPGDIIQTSLAHPWQAAVAASLNVGYGVVEHAFADASVGMKASTKALWGLCSSSEQRKSAAVVALKIQNPNFSRNAWMALSKASESNVVSGSLLHLAVQLRTLALRTSRQTAPPMLAAYIALMHVMVSDAVAEDEACLAQLQARGRELWLPSRFIGHVIRDFCRYPPLVASSFNAVSASSIPMLASVGVSPPEAVAYGAGVLWLATTSRIPGKLSRPEWLVELTYNMESHPLVLVDSPVRRVAIESLLKVVAGGINEMIDEDRSCGAAASHILPAADACIAVAASLLRERLVASEKKTSHTEEGEQRQREEHAVVPLVTGQAEVQLQNLASSLAIAFTRSAERLAQLLDGVGGESDSRVLEEVESRSHMLALGLEFSDLVSSKAFEEQGLLQEPLSLQIAGAHASCLELLRVIDEGSHAYMVATRGLDNAPTLNVSVLESSGPLGANDEVLAEQAIADDEDGLTADDNRSSKRKLSSYERRKRVQEIRNPYLQAIVAESRRAAGDAADEDLSDLEDFIVANPNRDYAHFISNHFPLASESEEEDEEEKEGEERGE